MLTLFDRSSAGKHVLCAAFLVVLFTVSALGAQNLDTREVRCKSEDYRYRECRVGGPIVRVRVEDRKSSAACRPGHSYGYRGNVLWVNRGCDAEFEVTYRSRGSFGNPGGGRFPPQNPYPNNPHPNRGFDLERVDIECKSKDYRRENCRVSGRIDRVELRDTDSDAACIRGRSWGWERDFVWVDAGCDGDFRVYYRSLGSSQGFGADRRRQRLSCTSRDFRQEHCFVDGRILDVRLLHQRSRAACRQFRSYGFRRNYVWVDNGCSADFEIVYERDRGFNRAPGNRFGDRLTCSSHDYRFQSCRTEDFIRRVHLANRKSEAPCRLGQSWGWEQDYIWVDEGCAAEFEVEFR
ncbi:MAG TPA: DUF3011 domain-containing protein [Acidobacteriota bacterium]|nr:DUF3011 domain-containing protein [Acidobacteriota bacterium]